MECESLFLSFSILSGRNPRSLGNIKDIGMALFLHIVFATPHIFPLYFGFQSDYFSSIIDKSNKGLATLTLPLHIEQCKELNASL